MANLYLPAPIRLVFGHKKLREPMRMALQLHEGATVFDLEAGALSPFLGREGLLQMASILGRPALSSMPVALSPYRDGLSFEKALLKSGVTTVKLLPRVLSEWESWRGLRMQAVQAVRAVLEHERDRFNGTGFTANDPELQVPPQSVAQDVLVTEVLDQLAAGELELNAWRPWLASVVDMAQCATNNSEREARMRWHIAVVCQHIRHHRILTSLEFRLGLEDEVWTLDRCGEFAGVSSERIRQLEVQVLERASRDLYLRGSEVEAPSVELSVAA